jgi:flagellar assembly protein FliH
MSARLIKVGQDTITQPFAPFAIPAGELNDLPIMSFAMPAAPAVLSHQDPETEGQRIISVATSKAADIERQARENGRALMQAEIDSQVAGLVEPWRVQLTESLEELASLRLNIAAEAERDLTRLAIEIAKKVVHREVTLDNEVVMTLARIALSRVHNRTAATIHLHPDDFAYVNSHCERLAAGHVLDLVEDRTISRGGCLVRTEMGDVDARIDQQFIEVERAFLET